MIRWRRKHARGHRHGDDGGRRSVASRAPLVPVEIHGVVVRHGEVAHVLATPWASRRVVDAAAPVDRRREEVLEAEEAPRRASSPGGAEGASDGGGGAAMAASTSRTRLRRAFSSASLATRRSSTSPRLTQTSVLSVDGRFFVVLRRRWTRHRSASAPRRKCACRKRAPAPSGTFAKSYMFIIRANDVQFRCLKYRGQTSSAKRFVSATTTSSPASDHSICPLQHARELLDEGWDRAARWLLGAACSVGRGGGRPFVAVALPSRQASSARAQRVVECPVIIFQPLLLHRCALGQPFKLLDARVVLRLLVSRASCAASPASR